MADSRGPAVDATFLAGWAVAVSGGLLLLVSASWGGWPASLLGIALAVGGFVTLGFGGRRPAPETDDTDAVVAPEVTETPEGGSESDEARVSVSPDPTPYESPALAPAPREATIAEPPAWAVPLPEPARPGATAPLLDPASSIDGPTPAPEPSRAIQAAPPPGEPSDTAVPTTPEDGSNIASTPPSPSAPEPVESEVEGEVLPEGTASSLALLGLPWDEHHGAAPQGPSPIPPSVSAVGSAAVAAPPPEWLEIPSIVFAPGAAARFASDAPEHAPWDESVPAAATHPESRSGAYDRRGGAPEALSPLLLVPGLTVLRPSVVVPDHRGLVTRVPEPPQLGVRLPPRCAACGDPSTAGATGENRCWGCGRPVCSDCFWRYGPGPSLHRCPSCAALGPPMGVSGGRRTSVKVTGPFGSTDDPDWSEGP